MNSNCVNTIRTHAHTRIHFVDDNDDGRKAVVCILHHWRPNTKALTGESEREKVKWENKKNYTNEQPPKKRKRRRRENGNKTATRWRWRDYTTAWQMTKSKVNLWPLIRNAQLIKFSLEQIPTAFFRSFCLFPSIFFSFVFSLLLSSSTFRNVLHTLNTKRTSQSNN